MKPSTIQRFCVGLIATVATVAACGESHDAGDDRPGSGGKADDLDDELGPPIAVTAVSVQTLANGFAGVEPPVDRFVVGDPLRPTDYLRPMSALGPYGPLGGFGPLGVLGPVGDRSWNSSTWIDVGAPWDGFAALLTDASGPLSSQGPLGHDGPLGAGYAQDFGNRFPSIENDFIVQLEQGGVFAPLGRVGPLGALGPLGPLGPVGAHGYERDAKGNYTPKERCHHDAPDRICRTVDVSWDGDEVRTYELFESYTEAHALAMDDNDTSFMVEGKIEVGAEDVYSFTTSENRFVTVVAFGIWTKYPPVTAAQLLLSASLIGFATPTIVPGFVFPFNVYDHDTSFDDIDLVLEITVDGETTQVVSDTASFVDWIHVRVPAGAEMHAGVQLASAWSAPWRTISPAYRLFVVGSTPELTDSGIRGPHQIPLDLPSNKE